MKKLPFILLLIACFAFHKAQSQCAVYAEDKTGIWGAEFDNGKPPYATMEEMKVAAKKSCEARGGKNCQLVYAGYETGWWVVVRGMARIGNENGYLLRVMYFETEETAEAQAAAEKRAIQVFRDVGGTSPDTDQGVKSWYVPKKQE